MCMYDRLRELGWVLMKNRCFWIMVLEKTLENPLDIRWSNQSILKNMNPEYLLERLMLKLKLQYIGHLIQTANSLVKTLRLGKIEGKGEGGSRRWDGWIRSLIQRTWTQANSGRYWGTGRPGVLQSMGLQRVGHHLANEQQQHNVFTLMCT